MEKKKKNVCVMALLDQYHLGTEASASPGNLLDIKILKFYSRVTESEILGLGPSNLCVHKPSWWF